MAPSIERTTQPAAPTAAPKPAATTPSRAATRPVRSIPPAVRLGGAPMIPAVRAPIERSLKTDLSHVRVHTGSAADQAAAGQSARAFTYGPNIVLGAGSRPDDLGLMAHEAAHVVQQAGAPMVQRAAPGQGDLLEREADRAAQSVMAGGSYTVQERTGGERVQRLGLSDALNYFADKANNIPGFRMFTIILGINPINMSRVERSAANIMRALIEFIPGGGLITQALDGYGIFDKVGGWVDEQIRTLGMTGSMIKDAITKFLDSLSWSDIFNLGGVWERAKRIFTEPIDKIISFAKGLVTGIIGFIKDAILMPLAKVAQGTRGWDLLIAILGKNPITGEAVPRNAETLIGGFMKLIGQEEIWNNMKKANAIARAWAWFQGAMAELLGFVQQIPGLFISALKSLELVDIVLIPRAFAKVASVFGSFLGSFISWAGNAVWNLLQIIFEVVAPGVMPYIKKAIAAFRTILKDPIAFVGNLVRAGKLGFEMFAGRFFEHLKNALIRWLTGPLGEVGVYIPKSFSLIEIVKLVLSVLGLTWQNIRTKLVKIIPEPVLVVIEKTATILVTLVKDGPAAAWEQIKAELTELKDQMISQVVQMVTTEVVKAAVVKLVSMLNPAGAVIQAIIAIYKTVTFFIEKINQIAAVVASFIDSIAAIAAGQVAPAAKRVEQTLANTLTLVVSFLAKFAGLGNIPNKLVGVIKKIRQPIDKGLDKIVAWLGKMLEKAKNALLGNKDKKDQKGDFRERAKADLAAKFKGKLTHSKVESIVTSVYTKYRAEGLKGVIAKPVDGKPDQYEAILIASKIKVANAEADFSLDSSDLDLGWPRTVATGMLTAGTTKHTFGTHRNDGTKHAEENLITQMDQQWEQVAQPKATGITNTLVLSVTRSPCGDAPKAHNCGLKIQQFAARWQGKYLIDMTVRAASIYGGKYRKTSKEAIQNLAKSGIKFTAWDLIAEMGDNTGDVKKETLDKLQKRIDSAKENIPVIIKAGSDG